MRVLFVTEDLANGGSERVVSILSNGIAEECDYESAVAAIRRDKKVYKLEDRVQYYAFPDENAGKIKRTVGRVRFLCKVISVFKPDVVVAFDIVPIVYSSICCKIKKAMLVVSERADPRKHLGKGIMSILYFKAFDTSKGVVFQTKEAQQYYDVKVQKKSTVIPNPINEEFNVPRYTGERTREIVTACRLTPQKNIKLFIDIVSDISKTFPKYKGVIYGEGPERKKLEHYVEENGFDPYIVFAGKVDDIKDRIYKSQFYLCTSNYEGISNSMLEAMALGLNVVSTDCPVGGARMTITTGVDGALFPVGDKEAGVAVISNLIENPQYSEEIGKEAIKICERWSSKRIIRKWIDYLNVINGK